MAASLNLAAQAGKRLTLALGLVAQGRLIFEVAEEPKQGQLRVLLEFGGNIELLIWQNPSRRRNSRSRGKVVAMLGLRSLVPRTEIG